ncbi:MAG: AAA family ATPase, partial [Ktedonobacterales bacterium]|nr:AAA family ATPase [Ktedonobacterales bacterium]
MGNLNITTLGDPQVHHAAVACTFTTRKALALTLYLAVTAQPHTRAHLVALLWPDADAAHGLTNLRQTLGRIRQALGTDADEHLLTPGALVRLDVGVAGTLDLTQVTAAIPATTASGVRLAALGNYRGSFCETLTLDDAPDFMAWVGAQQAHWDACYDVLAAHEVQGCLARGQAEDAVTLGKAWVRLRPDLEAAYRLLAAAQAAAGDVTGARLTLADCAQVWASLELALDPATVRLQEQMQSWPETAPASPAAHTIHLPFVGRQRAFDQLRGAYERARDGTPHLALIEGEAGVGKSRLLGAFTHWVTLQGADVVRGQAYELSGRFPFQPLAELVRARLARAHAPDDLLDDPWLTELSRLVPDLRERYPDLPQPVDDAGAGARLVEALAQVGLALARVRPVVWVLEDLHWADAATRAALTALLGRWGSAGVAIVL